MWDALRAALPPASLAHPLRVTEVGAGIGTMLERLVERDAVSLAIYTAVDPDPANAIAFASRLQTWAAASGLEVRPSALGSFRLAGNRIVLDVHWIPASIFDEASLPGEQDLVLAHAFLDLVDLDRALPRIIGRLRPGGLLYLSHNFDGLTAFLPEIDPVLDAAIVQAYHATMDERRDGIHPSGDSRTGRRLLVELPRHGVEILAAGASDWIIFPRAGRYTADEAVFLRAMLGFVRRSLSEKTSIEPSQIEGWIGGRLAQVEAGELTFLAHQLDILGRLAA